MKKNLFLLILIIILTGSGTVFPAESGRKILYYRNPMNPEVTSSVPAKDQMGMDYVPVYEEAAGKESGVYISPEKQQLIGVKKEKVEKRHLTYEIRTVGRIAYDPELYVAQQEYLQALKTKDATSDSSIALVKEQMQSLLEAAEQRLLLLGMSKEQIPELAKAGKPQQNLYLPLNEDTAWVYMTIYEYEIGLIKEGLAVDIDAVAFPGETFQGQVVAIAPVLDAMTRSANVRAQVKDPEHKLKPQMFVNARIRVDLGEKLAVPESAVLDSGLRKIVYLVKDGNLLEPREITAGQKAEGFYEVLGGLKEGDTVVTSGNFLVDSESKLKSVLPDSGHQHGE
jgi:membrane fusion protein, copper/silver efflux system